MLRPPHVSNRQMQPAAGLATLGHGLIAGPINSHDKLGYSICRFGALGAWQLCPVGALSISCAILINFIASNLLESR